MINADQYAALGSCVEWSDFIEPGMCKVRDPMQVRRFLHAKVVRVPGAFSFIGSVNFSNKAMFQNFEAGFMLADDAGAWLHRTTLEPQRFLPADEAGVKIERESSLGIAALFDWQSRELLIQFPRKVLKQYAGERFGIVDADGNAVVSKLVREESCFAIRCDAHSSLCDALLRCTWLTLDFPDATRTIGGRLCPRRRCGSLWSGQDA